MRLLIVEDNPMEADLVRRALARSMPSSELDFATRYSEAIEHLGGESAYDLVLTDLRLPDGDGLSLVNYIRVNNVPVAVVVFTGTGDEEVAVSVLKAGADDYIVKRDDYLKHLPLVLENAVYRHRSASDLKNRLLRVFYGEHSAADIDLTRRHMTRYAPHIQLEVFTTAAEISRRLFDPEIREQYDLILLDFNLPGLSVLDLLRELLVIQKIQIPILILTGHGSEETAVQTMKLGVADYIIKNSGYLHHLPSSLENMYHRTRLRREREALRLSEERYRRLTENAQDLIYRYHLSEPRGFEYINPAATEITGFTPEEHYADPDLGFKLVLPEDRELLESAAQGQTSGGNPITLRWVKKDGSVIWTEQRNVVINDPDGNPVLIEGIARDITNRHKSEEQLRASEEKHRLLAENSVDVIWQMDLRLRFTYISPSVYPMTGYTPEEWVGSKLSDHATFKEFMQMARRAVLAIKNYKTFENISFEAVMLKKDGTPFPVEISSKLLLNEKGRPIGLQGSTRDITERKRTEQALIESEERYRSLVEDMPILVCSFTPDWQVTFVNQAYCDFYRIKPDEIVGKSFLSHIPEQDRNFVAMNIMALNQKTPAQSHEHRVIKPNGEIRWQHWINRAIFDSRGKVISYQSIGQDITNRKEAEIALRHSRERLSILHKIDSAILSAHTAEQIAVSAADLLQKHLGCKTIEIFSVNWEEKIVGVLAAKSGMVSDLSRVRNALFSTFDQLIGLSDFKVIQIVRSSSFPPPMVEKLKESGVNLIVLSPMIILDNLIGIITLGYGSEMAFTEEDKTLTKRVADQLAIGIQHANLVENIERSWLQMQQLARKVISAQEEERQRISRELHDEAGQTMTALKINLELIKMDMPENMAKTTERINQLLALLSETHESLRRLAHDLRPPALDAVGLTATLNDMCEDFGRRPGLEIHFSTSGDQEIPKIAQLALYRFLQESLTNIVKHSEATRVDVELVLDDRRAKLSVHDNGIGFDWAHLNRSSRTGIGLTSMQERLELIGGKFIIESEPGAGTHLTGIVPIGNGSDSMEEVDQEFLNDLLD